MCAEVPGAHRPPMCIVHVMPLVCCMHAILGASMSSAISHKVRAVRPCWLGNSMQGRAFPDVCDHMRPS